MKESRFIELLNLYIDQRIAPEDAARLEEEILQNPRRREVYTQYCRMHRACSIALEQSQTRAAGGESPERRVVALAQSHRPQWGYFAAGLAAAACVAFVLVEVGLRPATRVPAQAPVAAQPAPVVAAAVPGPVLSPLHIDATGARIRLGTGALLSQRMNVAAMQAGPVQGLLVSVPAVPASASAASPRPSIEDFVFGAEPAVRKDTPKIFRARQPGDQSTENVAIEFQR